MYSGTMHPLPLGLIQDSTGILQSEVHAEVR